MAQTAVRDVVIWAKHIHGDASLGRKVIELRGGETLELVVDGVRGSWRKMDDGRDGRATSGIRPIGRMQHFWRELYATRRGDVVTLESPEDRREQDAKALIYPALGKSEDERRAALEAFLSMAGEGYSSDGWKFNRDELYDREDP